MESSDLATNNTRDADDVVDDKILESSNPESNSVEMEMKKELPCEVDTHREDTVREHEDIVEPINLNVETINNNISEETDVTETPHPDQLADVVDKVAKEMEENQLKTAVSVP